MPISLGLTLPNSAAGGIYNRVLGVVEQLLLDAYPNAAAAYSTRLLNTAYTGAALRVRRAADNVEVDVPFGANTALGTADMEGFLRSYTGGFGTNLLLYSEEFDNAYWNKTLASVSTNSIASPIDTLTAETYTNTVANNYGSFNRGVTAVSATYTLSVYVKANTVSTCGLELRGGGQNAAVDSAFSLTGAGSVLAVDNEGGATASIQSVGNGWYRVTLTKSVTNPVVIISAAATLNGNQAVGASIYVWGAQLELGSTATTYDYKRDTANTSAFVTTWYDQSGNGRHATQTTAANQPRIVNAGMVDKVNGRVSPITTANGQRLQTLDFQFNNAPFYMACVARQTVDDIGSQFTHGVGAVAGAGFAVSLTSRQFVAFGLTAANDGARLLNATELISADFSNGSTKHYVNSTLAPLSPSITTYTSQSLPVLIFSATTNQNPNAEGDYIGYVSEAIYYQSDQSANRAAIEQNIMSYFGITA